MLCSVSEISVLVVVVFVVVMSGYILIWMLLVVSVFIFLVEWLKIEGLLFFSCIICLLLSVVWMSRLLIVFWFCEWCLVCLLMGMWWICGGMIVRILGLMRVLCKMMFVVLIRWIVFRVSKLGFLGLVLIN